MKTKFDVGYPSIGHLPGSRLGSGDHSIAKSQAHRVLNKFRDKFDFLIVQEKLDGANCSVLVAGGGIHCLTRGGFLAKDSDFECHQQFYNWVEQNKDFFARNVKEGERLVGEWMRTPHGTIYTDLKSPFYVFDLYRDGKRVLIDEYYSRIVFNGFGDYSETLKIPAPMLINYGAPISIDEAMGRLGNAGGCGAAPEDGAEGLVYRLYTRGKLNFMAKYIKQGKIDGKYIVRN